MDDNRHLFIAIEGIDGVGKTTCTKTLAQMLSGHSYKTPPSMFDQIRIDIDSAEDIVARFLFYIMTLSIASGEIRTLLRTKNVICDRFVYSTIAYHKALGVDVSSVDVQKLSLEFPDFTFYLWAREDIVKQRMNGRKSKSLSDAWLEKDRELQARIHHEFLTLPVYAIDTSDLTPIEVCQKIVATLT